MGHMRLCAGTTGEKQTEGLVAILRPRGTTVITPTMGTCGGRAAPYSGSPSVAGAYRTYAPGMQGGDVHRAGLAGADEMGDDDRMMPQPHRVVAACTHPRPWALRTAPQPIACLMHTTARAPGVTRPQATRHTCGTVARLGPRRLAAEPLRCRSVTATRIVLATAHTRWC